MQIGGKTFEAADVLAGAYKGKALEARALLIHTVETVEGMPTRSSRRSDPSSKRFALAATKPRRCMPMTAETMLQSVFMIVQEAPGEAPTAASVQATSGEAALARVPEMAKDFFGEIPPKMRTWRIERFNALWTIYACEWSGERGEVNAPLRDIPASVLGLLMRHAGYSDGVDAALEQVLIDLHGGDKQLTREFSDAAKCWEGVPEEKRALASYAYTRAWREGSTEALNAKFQHRIGTMKGRT